MRNAYESGMASGKGKDAPSPTLAAVLERQESSGVEISKHQRSGAIDLAPTGDPQALVSALMKTGMVESALIEDDHVHVQYTDEVMAQARANAQPQLAQSGGGAPDNLRDGIIQSANALGIDPVDLATAISYETGEPSIRKKAGPTTQYGLAPWSHPVWPAAGARVRDRFQQ